MKRIRIKWENLNLSVKALLLEEKNPTLCAEFWSRLPFKGIQDHALISGEYLYGYISMPELCSLCHYDVQTTEARSDQKIGRINVSELQHFSIKYGRVNEYLKASPIAQVEEGDLGTIGVVGRHAWESTFNSKKLIVFSVTRYDDNDEQRSEIVYGTREVQGLVERINHECQEWWLVPPKEITDLVEGKTELLIGSFGFYFNSIVFVDGLMRSLGMLTLANLLRMVDNGNVNVSTIQEIINRVLPTTVVDFLEYCGFCKLSEYYALFRKAAGTTNSRQDIRSLVLALLNYVNRLSGWLLHYFPWALGKDFKRVQE